MMNVPMIFNNPANMAFATLWVFFSAWFWLRMGYKHQPLSPIWNWQCELFFVTALPGVIFFVAKDYLRL